MTDEPQTYVPFLPLMNPYTMPPAALDAVVNRYGIRLTWQKSHLCPCTYGGPLTGSPDNQCTTCFGRGWYWDPPSIPFVGLITFMHLSPSPDEPGVETSEKFGMVNRGEPTLTIPNTYNASPDAQDLLSDPDILSEADLFNLIGTQGNTNPAYAQSSINDVFTEVDTSDRFEVQLQVGGTQVVPYEQNVNIPASGAVTVYDTVNHVVVPVSGYVVSGSVVTLPGGYATGTPYIVSYFASRSYVAFRNAGGMAHDRPLGLGLNQPKRFRLQALDLWLRGSSKI